MGLGDRLRAWLRGDPAGSGAALPADRRRQGRRGGEDRRRRSGAGDEVSESAILAFARSRRGVEVYLEPRTNLYGHSVLLVADDGEYLRVSVPDPAGVRALCRTHGLPTYDVARTGYPRRVRDYDRGVRPERVELSDLPPWPGAEPHGDEDEPPPPPPPA